MDLLLPGSGGISAFCTRVPAVGPSCAQEVRGQLIGQLEGAAKDLTALLETARESDGDRLRRKACGSFSPGVSKLNLSDTLAVIRELRTVLPAQHEHEGLPEIGINIYPGPVE